MDDDPIMKGEFDRQFELRTGLRKRDRSKYWNTKESHTGKWESGASENKERDGSRWSLPILAIGGITIVVAVLAVAKSISTSKVNLAVAEADADGSTLAVARSKVEKKYLAIAAVKKFLDADSVEDMAVCVYDQERVAPLMKEYYRDHPLPSPVDERNIAILSSELKFETSRPYFLAVTFKTENVVDDSPLALRDCGDHFEIDWECYVGYNQTSLAQYIETRPKDPIQFRCIAKPSEYYNFEFSDESLYQAFQLSSPGEVEYLIGYVERSGFDLNIAERLEKLTSGSPPGGPVIVKVQLGSRDHLVRIVELVQEHWISE